MEDLDYGEVLKTFEKVGATEIDFRIINSRFMPTGKHIIKGLRNT